MDGTVITVVPSYYRSEAPYYSKFFYYNQCIKNIGQHIKSSGGIQNIKNINVGKLMQHVKNSGGMQYIKKKHVGKPHFPIYWTSTKHNIFLLIIPMYD